MKDRLTFPRNQAGKGSTPRHDINKYGKGYDAIKWTPKSTEASKTFKKVYK